MAVGRPLAVALALLLLAVPLGSSQDGDVQADVEVLAGAAPVETAEPGELLVLVANVTTPERANASWRAFLNASVDGRSLDPVRQQLVGAGSVELTAPFNVPSDAEATTSVTYELTVQVLAQEAQAPSGNETGNGTGNETGSTNATASAPTWQTAQVFTDTLTVQVAVPKPPPPGPPVGLIVGGLVLLIVVAGTVVVLRRRPRQITYEQPRSKTLRELDAEEEADKARKKAKGKGSVAPQAAAVAPAEAKLHPQVKILEARAADVRRIIELAKKRLDKGELTEHQFNLIRDKKEGELERIEEEIAQYREGDDGAGD